jgi:hypothetical protein
VFVSSGFNVPEPVDTSFNDCPAKNCIRLSPSNWERLHREFLARDFIASGKSAEPSRRH